MKTTRNQTVEIVTERGQAIPIYHTPETKGDKVYDSFTFAYIQAGARKRGRASTLEKARASAKAIARQLGEGSGHVHSLTPAEVADYSSAMRILRQHPGANLAGVVAEWTEARRIVGEGSIPAACEGFKAMQARESGFTPATVPEVYDAFIRHLEDSDASRRYLEDCRSRMGRAAQAFRLPIHSVRTADLVTWLDKLKVSPRTGKNFRTSLVTLWKFAKERGHLHRDRQTEAELIPSNRRLNSMKKSGAIGIYTPEQIAKILAAAPPRIATIFAIGAFAGLRQAELHRLRWHSIHADHIVIEADNAKTASRRIVPITANLAAWLANAKRGREDESLCRYSHENLLARNMTAAIRAAELEPVHNGLRHSFCTYRLASTKNAAQVALEAGNSPQMLFKHYRELATQKDAAAWFSVRPARRGKKVVAGPKENSTFHPAPTRGNALPVVT